MKSFWPKTNVFFCVWWVGGWRARKGGGCGSGLWPNIKWTPNVKINGQLGHSGNWNSCIWYHRNHTLCVCVCVCDWPLDAAIEASLCMKGVSHLSMTGFPRISRWVLASLYWALALVQLGLQFSPDTNIVSVPVSVVMLAVLCNMMHWTLWLKTGLHVIQYLLHYSLKMRTFTPRKALTDVYAFQSPDLNINIYSSLTYLSVSGKQDEGDLRWMFWHRQANLQICCSLLWADFLPILFNPVIFNHKDRMRYSPSGE